MIAASRLPKPVAAPAPQPALPALVAGEEAASD
jgi:hypothetical protein